MLNPPFEALRAHPNCLPIGTMVAEFEVTGLVGEGGFGIVYAARDTALGRELALKEFMPNALAGRVDGVRVAVRAADHQGRFQAGLKAFIKEARLLARFTHPALVKVYRLLEFNGTAYMAMRLYAGETLAHRIARGARFHEESIAQVMLPIFGALEMLHQQQVFHRDIAPDNIMLSEAGAVLLDFGSARQILGDEVQALTAVVKPSYSPIEQYVTDGAMRQGAWTDVYAVGSVLYHLATGRPPVQAPSRLLTDSLETVNEVTGNAFSPAFSSAVARAMAVRVEDRLQSIAELRELLGWSSVLVSTPRSVPRPVDAAPVPAQPQPQPQPAIGSVTPPSAPTQGLAWQRLARPWWMPTAALLAVAVLALVYSLR